MSKERQQKLTLLHTYTCVLESCSFNVCSAEIIAVGSFASKHKLVPGHNTDFKSELSSSSARQQKA